MNNETRMTLRLPNDLKEQLSREAANQNRSIHNMIITILRKYFATNQPNPTEKDTTSTHPPTSQRYHATR